MNFLFTRLRLWFYRYFIGYGEYRYEPYAPRYAPRRLPVRPTERAPLRPAIANPKRQVITPSQATIGRSSRGVA